MFRHPQRPGGLWLIAAIFCSVILIQVLYGILVFTLLGLKFAFYGECAAADASAHGLGADAQDLGGLGPRVPSASPR